MTVVAALLVAIGVAVLPPSRIGDVAAFEREDWFGQVCEGVQSGNIVFKFHNSSGASWQSGEKTSFRAGALSWNDVVDHDGNSFVSVIEDDGSHPSPWKVWRMPSSAGNSTNCNTRTIKIATQTAIDNTAAHEIGHALGLDHSGDNEGWIQNGSLIPGATGRAPVMFYCKLVTTSSWPARHARPSVDDQSALNAFYLFDDFHLPINGSSPDRGFEGSQLDERPFWGIAGHQVSGGNRSAIVKKSTTMGTRVRWTTPPNRAAFKFKYKKGTATQLQYLVHVRSVSYPTGPTDHPGCSSSTTQYANNHDYASAIPAYWTLKRNSTISLPNSWSTTAWNYVSCSGGSCSNYEGLDVQIQFKAHGSTNSTAHVDNVWLNATN